jgi:hypothetical protein
MLREGRPGFIEPSAQQGSHLLQGGLCPLLHLLAIRLRVLPTLGNVGNRRGPSNVGEWSRICLPGDLPGASRIIHSLCGALTQVLSGELFIESSPKHRLHPGQGCIAIASVLDHEACNGEKVNLTIRRVAIFKTEELLKDRLAAASFRKHRSTRCATIRHLFTSRHIAQTRLLPLLKKNPLFSIPALKSGCHW